MALIAVCEGHATALTIICAVLLGAGHQVKVFDHGLACHSRLVQGNVELLISDGQMPANGGFKLAAQLLEDKRLTEIPGSLLASL